MSYDDFWFVDARVQTTNLKRWFLWGLLLFVFVGICTAICVKSFSRPIKVYTNNAEYPIVTVEEAKQTNANGYIKGTVKNVAEEEVAGKYIQFTFYTKHDVEIGKEYVEIGNLGPQETKTYEAKFKYPNVERFVIAITDKKK